MHIRYEMQQDRKIIHIDMDAFYAAIEQRDHPELRGKPVIVGGHPEKRGVVMTCSYEARKFGIHSAMPSRTAFKLCPLAIFLPARFEVYRAVSVQIMQILQTYTHLVEPVSLDEAYLDVSENAPDFSSATQIAREIKQHILAQTQLTASAGVSFNKFIAKLASDYQKPDGFTVVPPEQAARFLDAIPIHKFLGVGKVTGAKLKELGILTGADLKRLSEERLRGLFHERGSMLYAYVRGEDNRVVQPAHVRKSVGKEVTLQEDTADCEQMVRILERLAEQVAQRLNELGVQGKTITLKVRWSDFRLITRSITLTTHIQDAQVMMQYLQALLAKLDGGNKSVRLLGVSLSNLLSKNGTGQPEKLVAPSLWDIERSL
jgi:DNA polymerase IV